MDSNFLLTLLKECGPGGLSIVFFAYVLITVIKNLINNSDFDFTIKYRSENKL